MCVCIYICTLFFAVGVASTLEQVFWAPVHVHLYALYRCSCDINVHIFNTFTACCAHMCICMYMCICMHMYMDAYVCLWYCLTRRGVVAEKFCLCIGVHVHICVYVNACVRVCMCACAYVCICIYVCLWICMHIHVYVHACGCTYTLCVGAFCLFVLSNPSTTCACITGVFPTPACVCSGGLEVGFLVTLFMVSACCWRGRLCFDRGKDRGFVLYISLFLRVLGW